MNARQPEYDVYNRPLRLAILEQGKGLNWFQKLQAYPIKWIVGTVPHPHAVLSYRRKLFGKWFAHFMQRAMRESQHWSKAELELFGGFTAKQLGCAY